MSDEQDSRKYTRETIGDSVDALIAIANEIHDLRQCLEGGLFSDSGGSVADCVDRVDSTLCEVLGALSSDKGTGIGEGVMAIARSMPE